MRYFLLVASILIISIPVSANDLGVSISIGQPGFYGQINLGSHYPRPQLIYSNPVLITPPSVGIQQQPIYLYVPPGHAKKWSKHCYRYNACNQPVYFIQENWYNDVYVPYYHRQNNYPGRYDSNRHDDANNWHKHPERKKEARRYHDDNYGGYNDRGNPGRGNDKHRGKHDQRNGDRKEKDRENRKD